MEEGTEFGETPAENLLAVAAMLMRDLEQAGFVAEEIDRISDLLKRYSKVATGGEN